VRTFYKNTCTQQARNKTTIDDWIDEYTTLWIDSQIRRVSTANHQQIYISIVIAPKNTNSTGIKFQVLKQIHYLFHTYPVHHESQRGFCERPGPNGRRFKGKFSTLCTKNPHRDGCTCTPKKQHCSNELAPQALSSNSAVHKSRSSTAQS